MQNDSTWFKPLLDLVVVLEVHREGLTLKQIAQRHSMSAGIDGARRVYERGMRRLQLFGPMETITGDTVGLAIQRRVELTRNHTSNAEYLWTPEWMRDTIEREYAEDRESRRYGDPL